MHFEFSIQTWWTHLVVPLHRQGWTQAATGSSSSLAKQTQHWRSSSPPTPPATLSRSKSFSKIVNVWWQSIESSETLTPHHFFAVPRCRCSHSPSTPHSHCSPGSPRHSSKLLLHLQTLAEAIVLLHHPPLLLQQVHLQETTLARNHSHSTLHPWIAELYEDYAATWYCMTNLRVTPRLEATPSTRDSRLSSDSWKLVWFQSLSQSYCRSFSKTELTNPSHGNT